MKKTASDAINNATDKYQRIVKMTEPYSQIQKSLEPLFLVQKQMERTLLPLMKSFETLNKIHLKTPIFNNPFVVEFEKYKLFHESILKYKEQTPKSLLLLAQYGWYLNYDCDLSLPNELADLIEHDKIDEVNSFLLKHFTDSLDIIFSELSTEYPKRKQIFEQILVAHKNSQYFISIPCILTQIDGISVDHFEKKFFLNGGKKNKYLPQVATKISEISDLTTSMFLAPLYSNSPINSHEDSLKDFPIYLNRHTIIHGVDTEYGTEINSLKCISLLKYLSDILVGIAEEKENIETV